MIICTLVNDVRPNKPKIKAQKLALVVSRSRLCGLDEILPHLERRPPAQHCHWDVVRPAKVALHLDLQVNIRVKAHEVVETLLVVTMAPLDLSVMPGCTGADPLVGDTQLITEDIQRMNTVRLLKVAELGSIIRLENLRPVFEVSNGTLEEVAGREAALFHVRVNEALSGGLVDDGVLVELLRYLSVIAGCRNIFNVHLPLDAELLGRMAGLGFVGLPSRRSTAGISQAFKYAVQGTGMAIVPVFHSELAIELAEGDVRIPAVKVADPGQLLLRMSFGMRRDRPVRLVLKRFLSAVEDLDPAKQRSPGNVITPADKADIFCGAVELTGMIFSVEFVWKISPGLCYSIHGGWPLLRMLGCGDLHSKGTNRFCISASVSLLL